MKYIDEFRVQSAIEKLTEAVIENARKLPGTVRIMEVCGTHTMAMFRHGIRNMLPDNIEVISGPGCPVCVTSVSDIDRAVALADNPGIIVTTFGDMLKVPGTESSLGESKARKNDVRVVYSALDALEIAKRNPQKKVVHIAIGFETTAPTIAAALQRARTDKLRNFYVFCAHKIVPPALKALLTSKKIRINAFLLPGHVSAVIGAVPYSFLAEHYGIPGVIAGFEAFDILQAVVMLERQIIEKRAVIENQYKRCVHKNGNLTAQKALQKVFKVCDVEWRGLGIIKNSGLVLRGEFSRFDAVKHFRPVIPAPKKSACRCGDVLQGSIIPPQCPLFERLCNPQNPIGPCMVSSEGACAAYYRYGGHRE